MPRLRELDANAERELQSELEDLCDKLLKGGVPLDQIEEWLREGFVQWTPIYWR
jgi:hypothetical protein